jgi:hypothetical protein
MSVYGGGASELHVLLILLNAVACRHSLVLLVGIESATTSQQVTPAVLSQCCGREH